MWARVASFEGDPADVDARLERLRPVLEAGGLPPELADARFLLLVDRASGGMLGITLFDSEEAMRKGDEAMNAGPGNAGSRASVEFYEGRSTRCSSTWRGRSHRARWLTLGPARTEACRADLSPV